ncbi:MAG: nuclear transport factor 2 family protein [Pseudomonadota bacterium]
MNSENTDRAIALTASDTSHATPIAGGSPLTAELLIDHAELVRIADAIDAGVDAKDWAFTRSLFTDEIEVDFTSLVGGAPAKIPADSLIEGWAGNLTAEKTSFHLRGNHRITFHDRQNATMLSHGYAWNQMARGGRDENGGNPMWEVWGVYSHSFVRAPDGWKVNAMSLSVTAERGNPFVRNTAGS